jgi:hypothetical protein
MRSPGFELNDAGSQSAADYRQLYGELRYRETTPRGALRRWATYLTPSVQWNGGGVVTDPELWLDAEATWKNFWRSSFTAFRVFPAQSQTLTRGGPLAGTAGSTAVIALLQNSAAATLQWQGRVYYGMSDEGSVTRRLSGRLSVRPGPRWQLSIEPNHLVYMPTRQYVATFDGGPSAIFGKTYVFSAVDRSELFADLRLTYLFTPDLSLEMYAEPFASSGRYHGFGELPAARARRLRPLDGDTTRVVRRGSSTEVRLGEQSVTVDDFNVRSFRSNAVLRWEWRPGSTLYLVWQQDRSGDRARIARVGPRSLLETLDAPGDNFLALKVTYWLPLH